MTDYTSKGSAALSFGYVSNSCHFMLSDHGCNLVRKGIFALLLVSHFSFQAFSPCLPHSVLAEKQNLVKVFHEKWKERGNHLTLEGEACGHGTHSGCFRVGIDCALDTLRDQRWAHACPTVAPSPFPLFKRPNECLKTNRSKSKQTKTQQSSTTTPQTSPKHLNLALPRSKQVS